MKSVLDDAGAIVARAIERGLIGPPPPRFPPPFGILSRQQNGRFAPSLLTDIEKKERHRIQRRDFMRRYRQRRRKNLVGVSRYDFPDGPEGYAAYQHAYRVAWLNMPGNREKMAKALAAWRQRGKRAR